MKNLLLILIFPVTGFVCQLVFYYWLRRRSYPHRIINKHYIKIKQYKL